MLIKMVRIKQTKTTILGYMSVGTARFFTLENAEKALPVGKFKVQVNRSAKFGRSLPLIWNDDVPVSRGYRIHLGNWYKNSEGCVLVGNTSDLAALRIGDSSRAERQIVMLLNNGQTHEMEVSTIYEEA